MDTPETTLPEDIMQLLPGFFAGPDPVGILLLDGHYTMLYNDTFGARFDIQKTAMLLGPKCDNLPTGKESLFGDLSLPTLNGDEFRCRIFAVPVLSTVSPVQCVILRIMELGTDRSAIAELERLQLAYERVIDEHERELAQAAKIQKALVPASIELPRVSCATRHQSLRGLGGDFGWVMDLPDGRVYAVICDVSGHGIGAGLMAHRLHAEALRLAEKVILPAELLAALDQYGFDLTQGSGVFFSFEAVLLDPEHGEMLFAGAGHPPAILKTPDGAVQLIESKGALLGCFGRPTAEPSHDRYPLPAGSMLFLYTDGITETFDAGRNQLGVDGLVHHVDTANIALGTNAVADTILSAVHAFREGPVTDDYTLMAIGIR